MNWLVTVSWITAGVGIVGALAGPLNAAFRGRQTVSRTEKVTTISFMLVFLVGMLGSTIFRADPRLDPVKQEQATWNEPEWQDMGNGIYRFPPQRTRALDGRTYGQESFPEILARFLKQHPELEIVSVTPVTRSSGYGSTTDYLTVLTKPKSKN